MQPSKTMVVSFRLNLDEPYDQEIAAIIREAVDAARTPREKRAATRRLICESLIAFQEAPASQSNERPMVEQFKEMLEGLDWQRIVADINGLTPAAARLEPSGTAIRSSLRNALAANVRPGMTKDG